MFRLLPWSSSIGGNKVMAEELKMLATSPHCAAPGVSSFALPQLKRKRSDSSDSAVGRDAPVAAKLRTDDSPSKQVTQKQRPFATENHAQKIPHESLPDQPSQTAPNNLPLSIERRFSDTSGPTRDKQDDVVRKVDVDKLRETLEAQLSFEVLLKHNELRLIDQEIAKCQVALEQLRRCAEIPYPGSRVTGLSQSVCSGTGVSVWAPGNGPAPLSPAPWGVTDGPYTRHYARWLLPDPHFDGGELDPGTPVGVGAAGPMEGRSTRGNTIDLGYLAGKSRPQRGSAGAKLQSLPSGYPPAKERAGPMIIRRKSDGVLVKLVCLDCRRDNFSSTQGFINHCRIAHNRNFASHDAAAVASGEPVEVNEAGAIVGGKNEPSTALTPGFVHPLIRSAHVIESSTPKTPSASETSGNSTPARKLSFFHNQSTSSAMETPRPLVAPTPRRAQRTPIMAETPDGTFTASVETPHLSSLMQLRGVGLDLGQLVGDAKTTVDLGDYSSGEEESDTESILSPSTEMKLNSKPAGAGIGRQPMRTTASQTASQRPDGHKGLENPNHKPLSLETLTPTRPAIPYQSPYGPAGTQVDGLRELDGVDHSSNLSPNTVESNQAPSLVSDDDDYEAASESDSPGPSSSEAEDAEDDFSHIDVEDDDNTTASTATSSNPNPKADVGIARAAAARPSSMPKPLRRGSMKKKKGQQLISSSVVPLSRGKDEKRVSFVSPSSSPGKGGRKDNNPRRR